MVLSAYPQLESIKDLGNLFRSPWKKPALQLLGHGMDVAEPPLQRMVLEDRRGARCVVGEVDRVLGLVDGIGRGHADGDAVLDRQPVAGRDLLPDLGHRLQQEGAGRAYIDLGLGEVALDHRIVPQRTPRAAQHLVAAETGLRIVPPRVGGEVGVGPRGAAGPFPHSAEPL